MKKGNIKKLMTFFLLAPLVVTSCSSTEEPSSSSTNPTTSTTSSTSSSSEPDYSETYSDQEALNELFSYNKDIYSKMNYQITSGYSPNEPNTIIQVKQENSDYSGLYSMILSLEGVEISSIYQAQADKVNLYRVTKSTLDDTVISSTKAQSSITELERDVLTNPNSTYNLTLNELEYSIEYSKATLGKNFSLQASGIKTKTGEYEFSINYLYMDYENSIATDLVVTEKYVHVNLDKNKFITFYEEYQKAPSSFQTSYFENNAMNYKFFSCDYENVNIEIPSQFQDKPNNNTTYTIQTSNPIFKLSENSNKVSVNKDEYFNLPQTLTVNGRESQDFIGWYYDEEFLFPINNNKILAQGARSTITIYPRFKSIQPTLHLDGGTLQRKTLLNGSHLDYYSIQEFSNLYQANKQGYKFIGWYLDPELTQDISTIDAYSTPTTSSLNLYAKYEQLHTLKLSGDIDMPFNHFDYQVAGNISLLNKQYTYSSNMVLENYYTDSNFTQESKVTSLNVTKDTTLYLKLVDSITVSIEDPYNVSSSFKCFTSYLFPKNGDLNEFISYVNEDIKNNFITRYDEMMYSVLPSKMHFVDTETGQIIDSSNSNIDLSKDINLKIVINN